MNATERDAVVKMALGRMFQLMMRPAQTGDVETYEDCRRVILDVLDPILPPFVPTSEDTTAPNYTRSSKAISMSGQ